MDEENLKSNPFFHVVSLTWKQLAITVLCGPILVPLRLILIFGLIFTLWIPFCLLLSLVDPQKAVTTLEKKFVLFFYQLIYKFCGVHAKYEGTECDPKESRIIVASPHMSLFEGIGHGHGNYLFSSVSGAQTTKWPIFGTLVKRYSIIVDKLNKDSRRKAHEGITKWLDERDVNPDLLPEKIIFACEGWYTNGSKLLPFKNGAFRPGRPVQVYVMGWESDFVPITTYGQNISWFWMILLVLAQPSTTVKSKALPVYYPNEEEKSSPDIYAANIAKLLSKEARIPMSDQSALEYLEEIQTMRDRGYPELQLTGWKRLLTSGSELQSVKKSK